MWLISPELHNDLILGAQSNFAASEGMLAEFEARSGAQTSQIGSRVLSVSGSVATINVVGALTESFNLMAVMFGGGNTTYPEIVGAIAQAEANPKVSSVDFNVDSGGGTIDGLFETLAAMEAMTKPTRAVVANKAASAAYALVAQTDEIIATNKAARFGSVGVLVEGFAEKDSVSLTSTKAPKKAADLNTPEGKAEIVSQLDAIHEIFTESIAEGRGVTQSKIDADFGKGAVLLAEDALKRGMIDTLAGKTAAPQPAGKGGNSLKANSMNKQELQAQHPDTFAEIVTAGAQGERERIMAHLLLGEASGDMATAMAAVEDGSEMTPLINAKYQAAAMKKAALGAQAEDDTSAAAGADDSGDSDGPDAAEQVADLVALSMGVEINAHA